MTALDRAFIRAYRDDVSAEQTVSATVKLAASPSTSGIPAPHARRFFEPAAFEAAKPAAAPESTPPQPTLRFDFAKPQSLPLRLDPRTIAGATIGGSGAIAATSASAILPLSAFRAPVVETPFCAGLEVDRFAWPEDCLTLLTRAEQGFKKLAAQIQSMTAIGQRVLAVSSCRAAEGRTTLSLCLAKQVAALGLRVALIDADFANPQLAARLGLLVEAGWENLLEGPAELSEALIESLADRLTLLPLGRPVAAEIVGQNLRAATVLKMLREHYDLVLLDTGPMNADVPSGLELLAATETIDAALLMCDMRGNQPEERQAAEQRLVAAGLNCLGIAENFCAA